MEVRRAEVPTQSVITEYTVEARLRSGAAETSRGKVRVEIFSPRKRTRRAMKALGMAWGAAVVCIFLPLAHFVLVPLALIAGPWIAYLFYRVSAVILPATIDCPKCRAPVEIERTPEQWPIPELCAKCSSEIHVCRILAEGNA